MASIGSGNLSFLWNCIKKLIQDVSVTVQSEIDLSEYQKKLTFDDTPTADSKNPVTSDGVKSAIDDSGKMMYKAEIAFEDLPTEGMKTGDSYKITDSFTIGSVTYPVNTLATYTGTSWTYFSAPLSTSMNYKGAVTYENLPTSGMIAGDAYKITNTFTYNTENYPAGILTVYNGTTWIFFGSPISKSEVTITVY